MKVVSWLCLFFVLMSVLSTLPAAAQDATPDDTSVESTTEQESAELPLASEQGDPSAAPIEVTEVTIACTASGSGVVGSFVVANPSDDVTMELQLVVDSTIVRDDDELLNAAQTEYEFEFALAPDDVTYGDSVVVGVRKAGVETAFKDSNLVDIAQTPDGGTTCGIVAAPTETTEPLPTETTEPAPTETTEPVQTEETPTETTEPVPTQTTAPATPVIRSATTATTTPSATATATPRATTTPTAPTGSGTVVNTGGAGLRCRSAASTSASIITTLAEGSKVSTRGAAANGWVPVICGGKNGFVSASYLKVGSASGSTSTSSPVTTAATYGVVVNTGGANLRCRTAPVTGATITLVPAGTRLATRGATSNGWVPVTCAGRSGWVSVAYFNVGGTAGTPPPSGSGRYITVTGTGGSGLRCRTAPVSGGIITVLGEGARVQTRGATSNGWIPVICAGRSGWVSAAYALYDISGGGSTGTLWLDVNLSTQTMRVYRGNTLIRSSLVSTGRAGFRTPTGTFYVNRKLPTRTMTGVLGGEYYYVPNVPWVMYFTNVGHAIHGAYWHNNFGTPMSHGCINLPVATANWLYNITPIGTRLRIHY